MRTSSRSSLKTARGTGSPPTKLAATPLSASMRTFLFTLTSRAMLSMASTTVLLPVSMAFLLYYAPDIMHLCQVSPYAPDEEALRNFVADLFEQLDFPLLIIGCAFRETSVDLVIKLDVPSVL